jgi:predicted lipoprotein with Yx(FWY)xxD motif
MRNRWWAAAGAAATAVVVAACGSTGSSGNPAGSSTGGSGSTHSSSGAGIKTASTSKGTVLTNAAGKTMYWYAIDTSTSSNCTGQCLTFWPPVPASTKVASGVSLPGTLGSVTDATGFKQLTYMGHPLYTFKLDTASGMVKGNGVTTTGGTSKDLWWAATPNMTKLSSSGGSSGGGGYGY